MDALPAALLAGLLAVDLLGPGWQEVDRTLLPGLAIALGPRACRRSHLTCILAAVACTAVLRALR